MLKSIAVLAGGRTTISAITFGRNILLARLVSVEDYGIASTFIIAIAFIELLADLGMERMVVQDRQGNSRKFVGTIQTIMVARGFLLAGLMYVIAEPIAAVFNHPELTWAYQLFGLVPLLHGFNNLNIMRMQRHMSFGPQVKAEFAGAIVSLGLLFPLAVWLGDYKVMLVALLAEYLVRCLTTQVIADRHFTFAWDKADFTRALKFGVPLLLSGMLAFAALQGDRVIVGNQFTARDLGLFSAAATLAMTPCLITAKISQSFFLPLLAGVQDDQEKFDRQAALTLQTMLLVGSSAAIAFSLLGPTIFNIAFGEKMLEGTPYVTPLGIAFSMLLVRSGSMLPIALARGYTLNPLLGNLVRLVSLPIAFAVAVNGGGILDLILVTIAAEIASLALTATLLKTKVKIDAPRRLLPTYFLGFLLVVMLAYPVATGDHAYWLIGIQGALWILIAASCKDLRHFVFGQAKALLANRHPKDQDL